MRPSRKSILNAVKCITGHSDQLSLFPYSSEYVIKCNSVKVCYRSTCFGCRYVDIMRKDYDFFTNNKQY